MNRQIKFRVWDKKLNKFTLGYDDDVGYFEEIYSDPPGIFFAGLRYLNKYSDRYIIQQYTGLTDKNGKEIYEGDIVKYNPDKPNIERIGIIEFSNYHNGWSIKDSHCYPLSDFGVYSLSSPFLSFNWTEIVGNIFEHSEIYGI